MTLIKIKKIISILLTCIILFEEFSLEASINTSEKLIKKQNLAPASFFTHQREMLYSNISTLWNKGQFKTILKEREQTSFGKLFNFFKLLNPNVQYIDLNDDYVLTTAVNDEIDEIHIDSVRLYNKKTNVISGFNELPFDQKAKIYSTIEKLAFKDVLNEEDNTLTEAVKISYENNELNQLDELELCNDKENKMYESSYKQCMSFLNKWENILSNNIILEDSHIETLFNISHYLIRTNPYHKDLKKDEMEKVFFKFMNLSIKTSLKMFKQLKNNNDQVNNSTNLALRVKEFLKIREYAFNYYYSVDLLDQLHSMGGHYLEKDSLAGKIFEKTKLWALNRILFGTQYVVWTSKRQLYLKLQKVVNIGNRIIPHMYDVSKSDDPLKITGVSSAIDGLLEGRKDSVFLSSKLKISKGLSQIRLLMTGLFLPIIIPFFMGTNEVVDVMEYVKPFLIGSFGIHWAFLLLSIFSFKKYIISFYQWFVNFEFSRYLKAKGISISLNYEDDILREELVKTFDAFKNEMSQVEPSADVIFIVVDDNKDIILQVNNFFKNNNIARKDVPYFFIPNENRGSGLGIIKMLSTLKGISDEEKTIDDIIANLLLDEKTLEYNPSLKNMIIPERLKKIKVKDLRIASVIADHSEVQKYIESAAIPDKFQTIIPRKLSNFEFALFNSYKASQELKKINKGGITILNSEPGKLYFGPLKPKYSLTFAGVWVNKSQMEKHNHMLMHTDPNTGKIEKLYKCFNGCNIEQFISKQDANNKIYNIKNEKMRQYLVNNKSMIITFSDNEDGPKFIALINELNKYLSKLDKGKMFPIRFASDTLIPLILNENGNPFSYLGARRNDYISYLEAYCKNKGIILSKDEKNELYLVYNKLFLFYQKLHKKYGPLSFHSSIPYSGGGAIFLNGNSNNFDFSRVISDKPLKEKISEQTNLILKPFKVLKERVNNIFKRFYNHMKVEKKFIFGFIKKVFTFSFIFIFLHCSIFSSYTFKDNHNSGSFNYEQNLQTDIQNHSVKGFTNITSEENQSLQEKAISEIAEFNEGTVATMLSGVLEIMKDESKEYKVHNSSLSSIAKKEYGSFYYWPFIYLANLDIISNPNKIKNGTILKLPKLDTLELADQLIKKHTLSKNIFDNISDEMILKSINNWMLENITPRIKEAGGSKKVIQKTKKITGEVFLNIIKRASILEDTLKNTNDKGSHEILIGKNKVTNDITTSDEDKNANIIISPIPLITKGNRAATSKMPDLFIQPQRRKEDNDGTTYEDILIELGNELLNDVLNADSSLTEIEIETLNFYFIVEYWFSLSKDEKKKYLETIFESDTEFAIKVRNIFIKYSKINSLEDFLEFIDNGHKLSFNKRNIIRAVSYSLEHKSSTAEALQLSQFLTKIVPNIRESFLKELSADNKFINQKVLSPSKKETEFRRKIMLLISNGADVDAAVKYSSYSIQKINSLINSYSKGSKQLDFLTYLKKNKRINPSEILDEINYSMGVDKDNIEDINSLKRKSSYGKAA